MCDKCGPVVTVKKVKKGTPTVIEYEGRRYILEHKDQYKGGIDGGTSKGKSTGVEQIIDCTGK